MLLKKTKVFCSLCLLLNFVANSNTPLRDIPIDQALQWAKQTEIKEDQFKFKKNLLNSYKTSHFIIYYGNNYPKTELWEDKNGNGIPYFVEKVANILEYVWNKEVKEFNLGKPIGNIPVEVYIANTGLILNGEELKLPDQICGFSTILNGEAAIVLNANPPFSPYTKSLDMVKITVAHEFFHTIQFNYKISTNKADLFLYEGTAVLMEKLVFPQIKDYIYSYSWELFSNPEKGLVYPNDLHPYSTVLFFDYLYHKFGFNIIKDIWIFFKNKPSAVQAIKQALNLESSNLSTELYNFYHDLIGGLNYFDNKQDLEKIRNISLKIFTSNKNIGINVYPTGAIFVKGGKFLSLENFNPSLQVFIDDLISNTTWINKNILNNIILFFSEKSLLNPRKIEFYLTKENSSFITLKNGWNLKSFPVKVDANIILNKENIVSVWKWNGNSWEIFIPDDKKELKAIAKKYKIKFFNNISPMEGVWIKTISKINLDLNLDTFIGNLKLPHKWNLVGNPSLAKLNFGDLYTIHKFKIIWVWNSQKNKWQVYVPPSEEKLKQLVNKYNIEEIEEIPEKSFKGFWIKIQ